MDAIIREDIDFVLDSDVKWESFRNKTVLITGAYGTLLSYVTWTLLRLNERDPTLNVNVIALVRDTQKAAGKFSEYVASEHLTLVRHDLASRIDISERVDFIIHGAGYGSPQWFTRDPVAVLLPNVIGTYHLLEFARARSIESFLFFSSGAVYSAWPPHEIVSENEGGYLDPLDVANSYAEGKRVAETMCKCWHHQFKVPVRMVRSAHIYGPTMDIDKDNRLVASFVNDIVNGRPLTIKSDGLARRSFCYIADATVAYFKVLLEGAQGEAYNVGNDRAYVSVRDLAEILVATFPELKLTIDAAPPALDGSTTSNRMLISSRKIENLGWKCAFTIPEGARRTVESIRAGRR